MSSVSANDEIEEDIDELDELARNLASRGSVAASVSAEFTLPTRCCRDADEGDSPTAASPAAESADHG